MIWNAKRVLFPERSLYKLTESHWFPKCKETYESRLDDLEREEEEWNAKLQGISEIQTSVPIGATPLVMTRYEKKQLDAKSHDKEKPKIGVKFWNQQRAKNEEETAKQPASTNAASTPVARHLQEDTQSDISCDLDTPISRRSYSLNMMGDSEEEVSLDLGTPISIANSPASSYVRRRLT
eukprot:CAMPEP_0202476420 /NCGR_PEP_ID=MMETSP1360-20130828/93416_1 /ASSEMBLY_ACC=CAM_ASM_000848 /TAXON_ID=515479 /ORGANISM="Licmophora paradoxa, Strain CCMP2313" /LENGTH=179 /DNA_ID=CAMNT_0049103627 /DNA_START=955 /DNA_END=1495 /DNA_ORIENTATION=-